MTSIRLGAAPTATAPAAPKQYKWSVNSTGSAAPTALGKGSHGHANQSGMFEGHNKIVMSEDTGSSDPTFLGTGSHGCETQQGYYQGHNKIVMVDDTQFSSDPTFVGSGSHGVPGTQSGMVDTSRNIVKAVAAY